MPSRNILVINCGSSSIKFALVNEAHSLFPCTASPSAWATAMRCCAGSAAATATA